MNNVEFEERVEDIAERLDIVIEALEEGDDNDLKIIPEILRGLADELQEAYNDKGPAD